MPKPCPFCKKQIHESLANHVRTEHGEDVLRKAVLEDKKNGVPDVRIGNKYGVSFSYLEKTITEEFGTNISVTNRKRSKINLWEPKNFRAETTTVWSFKNRGNWATHDGSYRGNWSPYIPRNLILRYTKPGELVLDYFVGGGTTAIEARLLGRRCIARDINSDALALTKENLGFQLPQDIFLNQNTSIYQPELSQGDARELLSIADESVDLISAHPPYAGIISYSANLVEGDLSSLSVEGFITEIRKVAQESYRVLKPGRKCAILIGDSRKSKHIIPIAFRTVRAFLDAGFVLRELVAKRQHNCKTTGFWYSNSIKYNFLLLAHEFLPIFEKPETTGAVSEVRQLSWLTNSQIQPLMQEIERVEKEKLETTSVWIFPDDEVEEEIRRNLIGRFSQAGETIYEYKWEDALNIDEPCSSKHRLVYIHCPSSFASPADHEIQNYLHRLEQAVSDAEKRLILDGYCIIEIRDYRRDNYIVPMGLLAFERLAKSKLEIREIVIVTSEENKPFEPPAENDLGISHRYLLIYRKP